VALLVFQGQGHDPRKNANGRKVELKSIAESIRLTACQPLRELFLKSQVTKRFFRQEWVPQRNALEKLQTECVTLSFKTRTASKE